MITHLKLSREGPDGTRIEQRGLLVDFLTEKARTYVEPTRTGTPRGEPIGLSGEKYAATLMALTSYEGKKTAKALRISHGLLRKWRTERVFKEAVDKHTEEFVERFSRHIKDEIAAYDQTTNDILKLSPSAIRRTQIVGTRGDAFADGDLYGDDLVYRLMVEAMALLEKKSKNDRDLILVQVDTMCAIDLIEQRRGRRKTPMLDALRARRIPFLAAVIKKSTEVLTLPNPTVEQRKSAIFNLTAVAQALEVEGKQLMEQSK